MIALILLGCTNPDSEPSAADKAEMMVRYTQALESEDVQLCLTLPEPLLSECAVGLAQTQVEDGRLEAAMVSCKAMPEGKGRDECTFQVVDTARLTGDQAITLCQEAGQFQRDCVNHAASRDVEENILRYAGAGNERIIQQQIYATARKYVGDNQAEIMSQDMSASWLARRWESNTPLTRTVCGNVGPDVCTKVYTLGARQGQRKNENRDESWRSVCGSPLTVETAREHGLPVWGPEMTPTVNNAWVMLCAL